MTMALLAFGSLKKLVDNGFTCKVDDLQKQTPLRKFGSQVVAYIAIFLILDCLCFRNKEASMHSPLLHRLPLWKAMCSIFCRICWSYNCSLRCRKDQHRPFLYLFFCSFVTTFDPTHWFTSWHDSNDWIFIPTELSFRFVLSFWISLDLFFYWRRASMLRSLLSRWGCRHHIRIIQQH